MIFNLIKSDIRNSPALGYFDTLKHILSPAAAYISTVDPDYPVFILKGGIFYLEFNL